MTPAQRHMGRVAAIGCILCRHMGIDGTPAQVQGNTQVIKAYLGEYQA